MGVFSQPTSSTLGHLSPHRDTEAYGGSRQAVVVSAGGSPALCPGEIRCHGTWGWVDQAFIRAFCTEMILYLATYVPLNVSVAPLMSFMVPEIWRAGIGSRVSGAGPCFPYPSHHEWLDLLSIN